MKICFAILGFVSIALLTVSIDGYNQDFFAQRGISNLNKDILFRAFGEFRDFISDVSFLKADVYFHGGIHEMSGCEAAPHRQSLHAEKEGKQSDPIRHIDGGGRVQGDLETGASLGVLLDLGRLIRITEHRHLSGNEEKEIMPWIHYAVRLDPQNELAYSVGGFWLARRLGRADEAIKFLKEGLAANPDSWEICKTLGEVYFFTKEDYVNAKAYLERAKELGYREKMDETEKRAIKTLLRKISLLELE
jgi:tetratricopeptide (TPR) repeat protein